MTAGQRHDKLPRSHEEIDPPQLLGGRSPGRLHICAPSTGRAGRGRVRSSRPALPRSRFWPSAPVPRQRRMMPDGNRRPRLSLRALRHRLTRRRSRSLPLRPAPQPEGSRPPSRHRAAPAGSAAASTAGVGRSIPCARPERRGPSATWRSRRSPGRTSWSTGHGRPTSPPSSALLGRRASCCRRRTTPGRVTAASAPQPCSWSFAAGVTRPTLRASRCTNGAWPSTSAATATSSPMRRLRAGTGCGPTPAGSGSRPALRALALEYEWR